jgi:ABC-type lipoprotein release transport system permease subunit
VKRGLSLFVHAASGVARRGSKAFALGGGVALAVALVSAVLFLTDALRADAERARSAVPDVVVQRLVGGRPSILLPSDAKKLDGIESVQAVRARVWGYVFVPALQGNVTVIGAPPGAASLADVRGALDEGRDLVPAAHEMIAGKTLARAMGLVVGDELGLPAASAGEGSPPPPALKLVGTFGSAVDLYAADVVLCDESDARALLGLGPGDATDLAITVSNPAESRVVAGEILARLPGTRVIEKELLGRVYALAYGRRSGLVLAASLPALLALLVLAWDRASGLGPEEKREIAILKAVGFSTKDVLLVKMLESLLVASASAALGLALGYAWVFVLGAPGLRPAIVGWSVLYPEGPLTPEVDLAQLIAIAFAVVAPFVGLSIVPAWRAATMDPMEAMRS